MDERNSVEVANELISTYTRRLDNSRILISGIQKDIRETKEKIENLESELLETREYLKLCEEDLKDEEHIRKDWLINLLALKQFVDNGGGLDMVVS